MPSEQNQSQNHGEPKSTPAPINDQPLVFSETSKASTRTSKSTGTSGRTKTIIIAATSITLVIAAIGVVSGSLFLKKATHSDDDEINGFSMLSEVAANAFDPKKQRQLREAESAIFKAEKDWDDDKYDSAHDNFKVANDTLKGVMPNSYMRGYLLHRIGILEYKRNNYKDSIAAFNESIALLNKLNPKLRLFNTKIWLAYALLEDHKLNEANALIEQLQKTAFELDKGKEDDAERSIRALRLAAYASYDVAPPKEAIAKYNKVLVLMDKQREKQSDSEYASIYLSMAQLAGGFTMKDHVQALGYCNEAIKHDPVNAAAYRERASNYSSMKDKQSEQLSDLNKALELNKKDSRALYMRAALYRKTHQRDLEIKDLTDALTIENNDDNYAHFQRGTLWEEAKAYDKALDDFTYIIDHPNKRLMIADGNLIRWSGAAALWHRANIYKAISKPDLAKADEAKASKLDKERKVTKLQDVFNE